MHSLHLEVCVEGIDTGYDLYNFSWIQEVFVGRVDGFSRKSKGHSPNIDLEEIVLR